MDVVRIELTQSQANYRREETVINKMTYPLPPLSTVIGAIHNACGYTEYHPMNVSIQGKYDTMQKKTYTDYAFLNSTMNDRGILVKLKNPQFLSSAYEVAAEACAQGADFDKEEKINVINRQLLEEYQTLRKKRRELDEKKKCEIEPKIKEIKAKIKDKKQELKKIDKKTSEYESVQKEIEELANKQAEISKSYNEVREPIESEYSKYASLTTSLKYYEVLYGIELVIHIQATDDVMKDIISHAYDIRSIGRSEDFVDIRSAKMVNLQDNVDETIYSKKTYSAYLPCRAFDDNNSFGNRVIMPRERGVGTQIFGTKYFMNKDYEIIDNKRIFHKKQVMYTSEYAIDDESALGEETGVYYDGKYIVGLV